MYARENYILDDAKICDEDAEGYFSPGSLPVDEKEEVLNEYFFHHLKDNNSGEDDGESEKYDNFNKYNAESDDCSVDPI